MPDVVLDMGCVYFPSLQGKMLFQAAPKDLISYRANVYFHVSTDSTVLFTLLSIQILL